jgi:hypothetical protein
MAYGTLQTDVLQTSTGVFNSLNAYTGIAKAWVNFNGVTGAINGTAFNVSSVTKNTTGNYSINFITAMTNTNYAGSFCGNGIAQITSFYVLNTTFVQVLYYNTSGSPVDNTICVATVFGS